MAWEYGPIATGAFGEAKLVSEGPSPGADEARLDQVFSPSPTRSLDVGPLYTAAAAYGVLTCAVRRPTLTPNHRV